MTGQAAAGVGGVRPLDLDYVGPHVGKHCGSHRALLPDGQIQDTDVFQRQGHVSLASGQSQAAYGNDVPLDLAGAATDSSAEGDEVASLPAAA